MAVSVVAMVLGVTLLLLGVVAGLLGGGIPFPDGPNAGFTSPTGPMRWLEHAGRLMMPAGALLLIAGALGGVIAIIGKRIAVR